MCRTLLCTTAGRCAHVGIFWLSPMQWRDFVMDNTRNINSVTIFYIGKVQEWMRMSLWMSPMMRVRHERDAKRRVYGELSHWKSS